MLGGEQAQCRAVKRRRVHDPDGPRAPRQQRLDLVPQRQIIAADLRDESCARLHVQLGGGVKDGFNLLPSFRRHHSFVNSRRSQASATFQSRVTVLGETCKTSAISLLSRPPKKRSSTTRALR